MRTPWIGRLGSATPKNQSNLTLSIAIDRVGKNSVPTLLGLSECH